MTRGGKRPGAGRPGGTIRVELRLTRSEHQRLNLLRRGRSFGRFIGPLLMAQPLSPFDKLILQRSLNK